MESAGKWIRSSKEDFCIYSLLYVYDLMEEVDEELHRGLLLIFLIASVWNHEGNGSRAPQGLLLIVPVTNAWDDYGNEQRTSAWTSY